MGVESFSELDRPFLMERIPGNKGRNRTPWNLVWNAPYYVVRHLERKGESDSKIRPDALIGRAAFPPPSSPEYASADKYTRRQVLTLLGNLLYKGVPIYFGLRHLPVSEVYRRVYRPGVHEAETDTSEKEIQDLYLMDGPQNLKILFNDIALWSNGNNSNQKPVEFTDRNTWSYSQLASEIEGLGRLMDHLKTVEGHHLIRTNIDKHGGSLKRTYESRLKKAEAFVEAKGEMNPETMRDFFTSLGYQREEYELLNSVYAILKENISDASYLERVKSTINAYNQTHGVKYLIP